MCVVVVVGGGARVEFRFELNDALANVPDVIDELLALGLEVSLQRLDRLALEWVPRVRVRSRIPVTLAVVDGVGSGEDPTTERLGAHVVTVGGLVDPVVDRRGKCHRAGPLLVIVARHLSPFVGMYS